MLGALPEYLDLARVRQQPIQLAGHTRLAALPRLVAAVADADGEAVIELQASHDGDQVTVRGTAQADLLLSCQRCFGKLDFPVTAEFTLAWVRSEEEAARLPDGYEPLLSASGRIRITEIIEDELLLALPMVALHATPRACDAGAKSRSRQPLPAAQEAQRRPFEILRSLKRR